MSHSWHGRLLAVVLCKEQPLTSPFYLTSPVYLVSAVYQVSPLGHLPLQAKQIARQLLEPITT